MLTRKQKELLLLIRDRLTADGVSPSFDEMKAALGLRSKSGIHRLITGLEERGFLKRLPHRARALEIIRLPEGMEPKTRPAAKRHDLTRADMLRAEPAHRSRALASGSAIPDAAVIATAASISLPLYGRIAAGTPIEALSESGRHIDVPKALLATARGQAAHHYVLEIAGDSMIEAGILDGDRVVIRAGDVADNGAIVVALVDDAEATLKKLERRQGRVALIPANRNYETKLYNPGQVKVQGRLVGLMRGYK
jgi:repressor LexA